jgi:hypothetical protein
MMGGGLPRIGEPYYDANAQRFDYGARCRSISPQQGESPYFWVVTCTYDNETAANETEEQQPGEDNGGDGGAGGDGNADSEGGDSQTPPNVLTIPPEIAFSTREGSRPATRDIESGDPVANSAFQTFDPPIESPISTAVLVLSAAQPRASYASIKVYQNCVNRDTLQIRDLVIEPGEARVNSISITEREQDGIRFDMVTVEIELWFKERVGNEEFGGWAPTRILDQGFMQLDGAGGWEPCVDANGDPVAQPVPLDGVGGQLDAGDPPKYLEYNLYRRVALGPLLEAVGGIGVVEG